jgi:hypothetical protein
VIFEIFLPKILAKKWRFWHKSKLNYAKILSLRWFLRKTPIFSPKIAKNRGKLWS